MGEGGGRVHLGEGARKCFGDLLGGGEGSEIKKILKRGVIYVFRHLGDRIQFS